MEKKTPEIGSKVYNPYRKEVGIVKQFVTADYVNVKYPSESCEVGHDVPTITKWMNTKKYQALCK